jgi:hypothetical protein
MRRYPVKRLTRRAFGSHDDTTKPLLLLAFVASEEERDVIHDLISSNRLARYGSQTGTTGADAWEGQGAA